IRGAVRTRQCGLDYLMMEYIEGGPLKGLLPLDQALKYAARNRPDRNAGSLPALERRQQGNAHSEPTPFLWIYPLRTSKLPKGPLLGDAAALLRFSTVALLECASRRGTVWGQFPSARRYARDRGFDVNRVAGGKGCYQQSSRPNIVRCPDCEDRGFAAGPISGCTGSLSEPWGYCSPGLHGGWHVQRPSARHTNSAMRSASWDRKPGGRLCPIPSIRTSSAPGMASAVARPPLTSHMRSARPWITRVGTSRCRRRSVRSPEATDATA